MIIFLNIFIILCIFAIGTLFGSFFSLATYRIPRKQDIVATRSYCPTCKHKLGFFDLIPILSYIFCLGKCRYCKEKISIRYPLLELSNGVIFVMLYFLLGYTLEFLIIAVLYALCFVLIGSYIMDRKLSDNERAEVKNLNTKLAKKSGVFISELIIAMVLFAILLVTSYIMGRNYNEKSIYTIAKANALSLAVKNTEIALATKYDELNSFKIEEIISGITYIVETRVYKYSDEDFSKKDLVKRLETKVSYMIEGKPYEFMLKTLKGKVN